MLRSGKPYVYIPEVLVENTATYSFGRYIDSKVILHSTCRNILAIDWLLVIFAGELSGNTKMTMWVTRIGVLSLVQVMTSLQIFASSKLAPNPYRFFTVLASCSVAASFALIVLPFPGNILTMSLLMLRMCSLHEVQTPSTWLSRSDFETSVTHGLSLGQNRNVWDAISCDLSPKYFYSLTDGPVKE